MVERVLGLGRTVWVATGTTEALAANLKAIFGRCGEAIQDPGYTVDIRLGCCRQNMEVG